MISKQDHAHERDPNQIGRCKHCSMWQCFNGRWHEKGTTCITAECKQELELAEKEVKPHLTAEEIAKKHGFIPRSYSPCQFEKCVAAIKEFLSQVPETLYCDVCESELQRESCNHVRPCPNCALKGPAQEPECSQCGEWREICEARMLCTYKWPATPAPSQKAAREWLKETRDWDRHGRGYIRKSDGRLELLDDTLEAYAREQTAAKDAEIVDLRRQRDFEWDSRKAASSGRIAAERERDSLRVENEALKAGKESHGA